MVRGRIAWADSRDRVEASDGLMVVVELATSSALAAGEMKRRQPGLQEASRRYLFANSLICLKASENSRPSNAHKRLQPLLGRHLILELSL